MRVVQIMNWHRFGGGSDFMARATADVLRANGHDVFMMTSDSSVYDQSIVGRAAASVRGVYSFASRKEMREILRDFIPDIVHVHEVYPAHSPWVLRDCKEAGVPVVMTCHDFRLTCPVATHISNGQPCDRCVQNSTLSCFTQNCRGNRVESAAFALRGGIAKSLRLFEGNIDLFCAPSQFVQEKLIGSGFPRDKFRVVPNMVRATSRTVDAGLGRYAAFAGRVAPEKGIGTLMEAAWRTAMPLHIAGHATVSGLSVPPNVQWLGHLEGVQLAEFYGGARFLVVPSPWFEAFGLVVAEAMMMGLPVIAANAGALPELVEHGVTGYLFRPGDAQDLARLMLTLWRDAGLCRSLGLAGRAKALRTYTASRYYANLVAAYKAAAQCAHAQAPHGANTRKPQVV
ncbi:MAG: glycosyltransferase [Candidatus Hydrogenedentes bacterium]|nr:glycosyltransferase [Candidatus Hydrogenedentota bacterium]